jgi:membrane fusion protein (multidrug efflux system)
MKKRNKSIMKWLTTISAIVILVFGLGYLYSINSISTSDDSQVQQLLLPVNARVGGYLKKINFVEFQKVKKGDTIIIIDNTDYLVQQQLAQANLLDAQAGKIVTSTSINTVANGVAVTSSNIEEVRTRLLNAEQDYKRYKILLEQESVTAQQFDKAKAEYDALKAKLLALQSTKNGNKLAVKETDAKLGVNEASILRAKAQLEVAKLNVSYTIILSPCDGYIGRKTLSVGQLVQAGQQLASVVNDQEKWLTVNVQEKQLKSVKLGQKVKVQIDAVNNHEFVGTISSIAGATGSVFSMIPTDNSTGNFVKIQQRIPIRIDFLDPADISFLPDLKSGMNAVVNFN